MWLLLFLLFCNVWSSSAVFHEELLVRPLPDGKVMAHFQFTTQWEREFNAQHFDLFPKSFGQIVQKFDVDELHLSFTQGRWQYERWGYPLVEAPVGAEMWAWFNESTSADTVDTRWSGLVNALSGLFCASLNFLDGTLTSSPHEIFPPMGISHADGDTNFLRYATLPRETVCTENLTPWMKFLPCKHRAGIATLLNALKLYDVHYHSMGAHYRLLRLDGSMQTVELAQTLTVVLHPMDEQKRDWSLGALFNRPAFTRCPLAEESNVYLELHRGIGASAPFASPAPHDYSVNPTPDFVQQEGDVATLKYVLNGTGGTPFNLELKWAPSAVRPNPSSLPVPALTAHRFFTGYGQQNGGIAIHLFNTLDMPLQVSYFDMVPWYLRLYFHTLEVSAVSTGPEPTVSYSSDDVLVSARIVPAEERVSPATIELVLSLPPASTTIISIEFEKVFLRYLEHPPDANRGFDIGAGVVKLADPAPVLASSEHTALKWGLEWSPALYPGAGQDAGQSNAAGVRCLRIYTESLLVSLPTPDFSMPYNVITFTCTVFALFFGSMLNVLTRDFSPSTKKAEKKAQSGGLLRKLFSFLEKKKETKED